MDELSTHTLYPVFPFLRSYRRHCAPRIWRPRREALASRCELSFPSCSPRLPSFCLCTTWKIKRISTMIPVRPNFLASFLNFITRSLLVRNTLTLILWQFAIFSWHKSINFFLLKTHIPVYSFVNSDISCWFTSNINTLSVYYVFYYRNGCLEILKRNIAKLVYGNSPQKYYQFLCKHFLQFFIKLFLRFLMCKRICMFNLRPKKF